MRLFEEKHIGDKIEAYEHNEPFDDKLKDFIVEYIYNKITEVRSNNFEPKFVVLSRKSYTSLVAHIMETGNILEAHVDGTFPNTIFGLPIVMAGDTPLDIRVLTDARDEYRHDMKR